MRALGVSRISVATGGNWARDPLWKNARAVPSLDLRFAKNKSLTDATTGASLVSFTRASTGTYVGSDGVLQTAVTNEARFDHNPTTGESLGLLVEEARTNLLLNSATLSTQSVTVAAAANTLSFYGTGTVTLTGVSTDGPLVGTSANYLLTEDSFALMYEDDTFIYQEVANPSRVSLTFTPTAGVLTLTVSGSVTNAQLEAGAFPTSYIPTTTATVTRAADVVSITGTAFSSFYNQTDGTVFVDNTNYGVSNTQIASFSDNSTSNCFTVSRGTGSGGNINLFVGVGGVAQVNSLILASSLSFGLAAKVAVAVKASDFSGSVNGLAPVTQTTGSIPTTLSQLTIGNGETLGTNTFSGTIRRLTYWPVRLPNPTLQAITTP